MHAKSVQSVNHDISTRERDLAFRHACLEVRFGFKKKIGSLSEGSVPVIELYNANGFKKIIIAA
jgi:hypothetical protein